MKSSIPYILLVSALLLIQPVFGSTIRMDADFSSVDIYNTLTATEQQADDTVTLQVDLKNEMNTERMVYLSIINPTIDKIIIEDTASLTVLGDLIPFTKRTFKHINHVYPVLLKARENRMLKVSILKRWHDLNFRVVLSSENSFIKTTNHDNFFIGIFYGIFFMYLLLLICFYIFSKSNFFTIYLVINLFALLLLFQYSGTGYQYGWFFSAGIQKYMTVFAVTGYLAAHISFIRIFFAFQFKTSFNAMILRIMLYSLLVFSALFLVQYFYPSFDYLSSRVFYYAVNGLFFIYSFLVLGISVYTYLESRRRETMWVFVGMLIHIANWMIFINNEFVMIDWLNRLDNFKLFYSHIYLPQINYYIMLMEMFIVTIFISINYHKLIKLNNISVQRLDFLQKININTFVLGQEEEREKITQEINTSISRDILKLKQSLLDFTRHHEEKKIIPIVLNDIDRTLEDIENITGNYVAPDMQQMKLAALISTATEKLFSEISVSYDLSKIPEHYQLNPLANINLYRILQEISNNILKHAEAKQVSINVIKDAKSLQIKITDDGIGFSESVTQSKGIGLMNIESRMNSLNGSFYILSNEKSGSTMHLIMPLKDISG